MALPPAFAAPPAQGSSKNPAQPIAKAAPTQAAPAQQSAAAQPERTPAAQAGTAPDDAVSRKLKAAIMENIAKLGTLEPWQQRILEEEAVPQYQRFIRNYRSSQTHSGTAISSLVVDIDMESLKNYLKFYAPKSLGVADKAATALLYVRSEPGCDKCATSEPIVRKLAFARMTRRGLTPVWLTTEELGLEGPTLKGKALDDKISEIAAQRGVPATLVLQWGPAAVEEVDSVHADEKKYTLHTLLVVRGIAGTGGAGSVAQISARSEGHAELLENDPFETSTAKLLSDAFTEVGADAQKAELAQANRGSAETTDNETHLDVGGVRDFAQLTQLKALVQGQFSKVTVEERMISRGRVVLALTGEVGTLDSIKTRLNGLAVAPGKLYPAAVPRPLAAEPPPATPDAQGGHEPASVVPETPVVAMEIR